MNDKVYIKTSDLNLAATLLALGFIIPAIDYVDPNSKKMEFYFDKEPKVEKAMQDYWNKALKVEPTELFNARREILTRIKNE
jgi:hypothetical protein